MWTGDGGVATGARAVDEEALVRFLGGRPDVAAAYLFGSRARGGARAGSDTDVAVLFAAGLDPVARLERRVDMAAGLERAVGGRVDVVDLEEAGAVLVHQVLKYGRLLVERDPARRVRFEVAARRRYLDGQRRREEYLRGGQRGHLGGVPGQQGPPALCGEDSPAGGRVLP